MMNLTNLFRYSLPAGLLAFFWLTMRTVAYYSDESMTSYGFPFSWYASSSVSSMAYDLAIGPFIIDIIFYFLTCHIIICLAIPNHIFSSRFGIVISILLWLAGSGSMFCTSMAVSLDPHFVVWSLDSYFGENAKRSYNFHFGTGLGGFAQTDKNSRRMLK